MPSIVLPSTFLGNNGAILAGRGDLEELQKILDKGDKMEIQEAFVTAARWGQLEVIKRISDKYSGEELGTCCLVTVFGPIPDCRVDITERAMKVAARNGHLDIIKHLKSMGEQPYYEDIDIAVENGHLELVKYLAKLHSVVITDSCVQEAIHEGYPEIVEHLMDASRKITTEEKTRLLKAAVGRGNWRMVKAIAENGAAITPEVIHKAVESGYYDIADYLSSKWRHSMADEEYLTNLGEEFRRLF